MPVCGCDGTKSVKPRPQMVWALFSFFVSFLFLNAGALFPAIKQGHSSSRMVTMTDYTAYINPLQAIVARHPAMRCNILDVMQARLALLHTALDTYCGHML